MKDHAHDAPGLVGAERTDWIALSDRELPAADAETEIERGVFVLECRLPILEPAVLIQSRSIGAEGEEQSFSIFFDPETGISLLHRLGATLRRHRVPGPIVQRAGIGRLTFRFDAGQGSWSMEYLLVEVASAEAQRARGTLCLPMRGSDLRDLCAGRGDIQRHPAVLWFGLSAGAELPRQAAWLGLNTPVETRRGPVRAGLLRPGDLIATLEDGYLPLMSATRRQFPSRGSFAPVILRSPFFGAETDLLVASNQLVLIAGATVEYLFGEDEVLVSSAALADGKVAVKDDRRAMTDAVTLDLGRPAVLISDGCCLVSAPSPTSPLPRRSLLPFEALALLAHLGRISLRHVA